MSAHKSKLKSTYFFRIKFRPFLIVKLFIKRHDINRMHKIDESVTDIALISKINGEIKEVKKVFMSFIQKLDHHFLMVFIRDVTYHQSSSFVFSFN